MYLVSSKIIKAVNFATIKHAKQIRKDKKTPYIAHPLAVALVVGSKFNANQNCVISAILHDTLEDTKTTKKELIQNFGSKVASIVVELTDDCTIERDKRKNYSIDKIKSYSNEAAIVKYCDILCNMQELEIQLNQDINIIKAFNWTIKEKLEYEQKRLRQFNKFHKSIKTLELKNCLKNIKVNLNTLNLYN